MDVRSLCPLPVAAVIWQPARGRYSITVVCKATYDLVPGASALSQSQEHLLEDDAYLSNDPARSLYAPSDRVPMKPRADVLLVGHAFAPRGEPVASLFARIVIGDVDKSIEVTSDRSFTRDGAPREGPPFLKMPLVYERAAAGSENPVGVRMDAPNAYGLRTLPNLLPPGITPSGPSDSIPTIGFGPIAPSWPSRAARLGAYAGAWPGREWTQQPIPEGIDPSFWNAAPRDQQVEAIRSDERIVLEGLHPGIPRLVTSLPGVSPQAFIELAGRAPQAIVLVGDTLWIDTDRSICTVTWRGSAPLDHPSQMGRVLVAMAKPGERLTWADVEALDRGRGAFDSGPPTMALPSGVVEEEDDDDARVRTVATDEAARLRAALPFAAPFMTPAAPVSPIQPGVAPPAIQPPPVVVSPIQPGVAPPAIQPPPAVMPAASSFMTSSPPASPWSFGQLSAPLPVQAPAPAPFTPPVPAPPAAKVGGAAAEPPAAARVAPREYLDLLWFERAAVPRMRASKAWSRALAAPEDAEWGDGDATWSPSVAEANERALVLQILTKVKPLSAEEMLAVSADAMDEGGAFSPPLVVMKGEVELTFDEIEALKAHVTVVGPLASNDKRLREAVDAANEALRFTWPPSAAMAEGLTARIREAFAQSNRALPGGYLEASVERALLGHRLFQKRTILGKPRLRCLFTTGAGGSPMPLYLPESLASHLPMFQRFRAVIAAEVQGQQDQYESHPAALLALALGRLIPAQGAEKARSVGGR